MFFPKTFITTFVKEARIPFNNSGKNAHRITGSQLKMSLKLANIKSYYYLLHCRYSGAGAIPFPYYLDKEPLYS